jgi:hypothetical protein
MSRGIRLLYHGTKAYRRTVQSNYRENAGIGADLPLPAGLLRKLNFSAAWYTPGMDDRKHNPTPPLESMWPPAPLHDARTPLSFRVEGVELTQSDGRLIVINHCLRRLVVLQTCLPQLFWWVPFFAYWIGPFHHPTWRAMLPVAIGICQKTYIGDILLFFVVIVFYMIFVAAGTLSGIVLNQRDGTAKANGRTRSLNALESVKTIKQPGPFGRGYQVQLLWNNNQTLPRWKRVLFSMGPKTTFGGIFRQEANAEKVAEAVAEFAGVSVQHRTSEKK